jgi:hypothetical protein
MCLVKSGISDSGDNSQIESNTIFLLLLLLLLFFVYILKKPKEKANLWNKEGGGKTFSIHGGKDVDRRKRMRMQQGDQYMPPTHNIV